MCWVLKGLIVAPWIQCKQAFLKYTFLWETFYVRFLFQNLTLKILRLIRLDLLCKSALVDTVREDTLCSKKMKVLNSDKNYRHFPACGYFWTRNDLLYIYHKDKGFCSPLISRSSLPLKYSVRLQSQDNQGPKCGNWNWK